MADEADLAFDSEQRHLTQALDAQRQLGAALRPVGHCHNCGSEDAAARLFCDRECAADWEYQDTLRRKLGRGRGRAPAAPGRSLAQFAR